MRPTAGLIAFFAVVDLFGGTGAARAEFQFAGSAASMPPANSVNSPEASAVRPSMARAAPRGPGSPLAYGFGRQVPLAFALRQIVPKGVAVGFADDLDPEAVVVDWNGGRPWPDVLRSMLRQPGLQATFKTGSVLIERVRPS